MRTLHATVAIAGTALLLAGCGDGGTGPAGDSLTQAEVTALMAALESLGTLEGGGSGVELDEGSTSETVTCPLGGDVMVAGTVSDASTQSTIELQFDVTLTHRGCRVSGNGITFTLDGSPGLRQAGFLVIVGFFESIRLNATLTGGLGWAMDGKSGTCGISVTMAVEASEASESGTVSGTVCGVDYSENLSIS